MPPAPAPTPSPPPSPHFPFTTLPTELQYHILSFLSWNSHTTISLVSRSFHALILQLVSLRKNRYRRLDQIIHDDNVPIGLTPIADIPKFTNDRACPVFIHRCFEGISMIIDRSSTDADVKYTLKHPGISHIPSTVTTRDYNGAAAATYTAMIDEPLFIFPPRDLVPWEANRGKFHTDFQVDNDLDLTSPETDNIGGEDMPRRPWKAGYRSFRTSCCFEEGVTVKEWWLAVGKRIGRSKWMAGAGRYVIRVWFWRVRVLNGKVWVDLKIVFETLKGNGDKGGDGGS